MSDNYTVQHLGFYIFATAQLMREGYFRSYPNDFGPHMKCICISIVQYHDMIFARQYENIRLYWVCDDVDSCILYSSIRM